MPGPGITRPDLCSKRAAARQPEFADTARGPLSADSYPPAGDDPLAPMPHYAARTLIEASALRTFGYPDRPAGAPRDQPPQSADGGGAMTALPTSSGGSRATAASSIDHAIRLSTAAAVLAVAGIAAYVSYWHAYAVIRAHGGSGITARLEPATIDGLVYASSMVILYAARHRVPVPSLARWLLGLGIAAALTVNMAQGWAHGPIGAVVAAWPAVSLVGSHELLVWLIRTAGTLEREPPAEHRCGNTACRAAARSAPAVSIDSGRHRRNDRDLSAQGWPLTDQPARQPVTLASVENSDGVPGAGTDNDAAVAAYRLSVQAGNPLSERKLAQMFGRTSRRWARARIADAQQSP
jgi:hypothetical protein